MYRYQKRKYAQNENNEMDELCTHEPKFMTLTSKTTKIWAVFCVYNRVFLAGRMLSNGVVYPFHIMITSDPSCIVWIAYDFFLCATAARSLVGNILDNSHPSRMWKLISHGSNIFLAITRRRRCAQRQFSKFYYMRA